MTREMIIDMYEKLARKSYRTNLKKYSEEHVFDEDKSVKWNRDEVIRQNQLYKDDLIRLKKKEKEEWDKVNLKLYSFLSEEYDLNMNQIEKLYNYAYAEGHSDGIRYVLSLFDELVDLYSEIRELE